MLKIIGETETYLNFDDYYIIEDYSGKGTLGFTLPLDHEAMREIVEETPIVDLETGQRYLVKAIDEGALTANIKAELDLDELCAGMQIDYSNNSNTAANTIKNVLLGGWTVEDHAHFTQYRTISLEAATPLDVINACYDTYGIVCRFDNQKRIVSILDPESGQAKGAYLTDELNLLAINMKGKSSGFATRLYARGKDGMTFASVNGGKDYVEDHTYSDKIISVFWKDERYTIPENMLEAARKRLASLAVPQQSYTCSILDLARAKEYQSGAEENIYSFLDFALYESVVLIDRRRKRRVTHRVVQIKRYPHYPEKNEITLSTTAPSIQNTVRSLQEQLEKPTSDFNRLLQAGIQTATELITGQLGGNYIVTTNPETGKPNGWVVMDTDNIETAKNVWRMSLGGLGHSHSGYNGPFGDVALTMDGKINASCILTGELWGSLIKSGRIESVTGAVYFDLEANDGKGELASSVLKSVEDDVSTTAQIGSGAWSDGSKYQGFVVRYPGGKGNVLVISLSGESDYPLANETDIASNGDLTLRSNAISTNPGGNSSVNLRGSSNGEGSVLIRRGTRSGSDDVFYADENTTGMERGDDRVTVRDDMIEIEHRKKIQFSTGGYARASIESNGSAHFGDLYTNGTLVTSDREKKTSVRPVSGSFLDKLTAPVYRYRLKEDQQGAERVGLLYDEAPEEIRREDENGNKAIDLYGMVSLLWKAVQELKQKVDTLEGSETA